MAQSDDIGFKDRGFQRKEGKGSGNSNEAQGRRCSPSRPENTKTEKSLTS